VSNPLHARYYADRAVHETVEIVENEALAAAMVRLRFESPALARKILPGQFLMVRLADWDDPLLGRPLALYDVIADRDGNRRWVDVVYLVAGKFTSRLARLPAGQRVSVWGPLGNGFPVQEARRVIMVAGGIGQTPFVAVAAEALGHKVYGEPPRRAAAAKRVTLCYGARTAEMLAGVEHFESLGAEVRLATEDGSRGHRGRVTELLASELASAGESVSVLCCGPEPMMEAAAEIAAQHDTPCLVSLETPMACGIGICFTCVAKVKQNGEWDYKRTCVDGPVFSAAEIEW